MPIGLERAESTIMGPAGRRKPNVIHPEGEPAAPALRGEARKEAHERARLVAEEAARVRSSQYVSLSQKVERAAVKMNGRNTAGAIVTVQAATPRDAEILLLAEEYLGKARSGVLKQFPKGVSKNTRAAFLQERGIQAPTQSADEAATEGE